MRKKAENKRVVAYCRVSTEMQIDNTSIDNQKEKIQDYCKLYDYALVKIFTDNGRSGSFTESREEYGKMMEFIKDLNNDVGSILCYKSDRMHRSLKNLLIMIEDELMPNNIGFISITENFDTTKESGMLFLQMIGSFSEFERKTILRRCKEGRIKKATDDKFAGGGIPYGYVSVDGDFLDTDKDRAIVVKDIFKYRVDGYSFQKIADMLNKRGIESSRGNLWSKQAVFYILKNRAYIGEYLYDGNRENNAIVCKIPKIVSKQLFNKANS